MNTLEAIKAVLGRLLGHLRWPGGWIAVGTVWIDEDLHYIDKDGRERIVKGVLK